MIKTIRQLRLSDCGDVGILAATETDLRIKELLWKAKVKSAHSTEFDPTTELIFHDGDTYKLVKDHLREYGYKVVLIKTHNKGD